MVIFLSIRASSFDDPYEPQISFPTYRVAIFVPPKLKQGFLFNKLIKEGASYRVPG